MFTLASQWMPIGHQYPPTFARVMCAVQMLDVPLTAEIEKSKEGREVTDPPRADGSWRNVSLGETS